MNQFFLNLPPKIEKKTITYNSNIILFGSCFVENIGRKFDYFKFQNTVNPFGIIFHPEAINNLLERIVSQKQFTEKDLFFHNDQWHCFEVHSKWSNVDKAQLLNNLNSTLKEIFLKIKNASHFIITYGTAWGYQKNDFIVANCHKIPQKEFKKTLSSINTIEITIKNTFDKIYFLNPKLTIIATVSPVRHIKDGIIENNRSKAHLLSALHNVVGNSENTNYYPSYELIVDCLRDYRFYKKDLVHPNQTAIDYVWEHFKNTWIHKPETNATIKLIQEIQQGLSHKPFNPDGEAHKKFVLSLEKKKQIAIKKHPFLEF